jgi:hypothetical protein
MLGDGIRWSIRRPNRAEGHCPPDGAAETIEAEKETAP